MKLVIDTNVLLVSVPPLSPFNWFFQLLRNGKIEACVTTEILLEYHEVIARESSDAVAEETLKFLCEADNVHFIVPHFNWNLIAADPDDNKFADCAFAAGARYLVSNDRHFQQLKRIDFPRIEVLTLEEFETLHRK